MGCVARKEALKQRGHVWSHMLHHVRRGVGVNGFGTQCGL